MKTRKVLGITSMLFATVSAMLTLSGLHYASIGFAIAAGICGIIAGWQQQ